jgi:hypothetical protein
MPIALVATLAMMVGSSPAAAWNGTLNPSDRLGVYLDVPEADQASFALMEEGGDALETLFPQTAWTTIDSTPNTIKQLGGLKFENLGALCDTTSSSEIDRQVLAKKIGKGLGLTHILVIRKGGFKAARDSSASFADLAILSLRETGTGTGLLQEQSSFSASKGKRSAEVQWAKEVWSRFSKSVMQSRGKAK